MTPQSPHHYLTSLIFDTLCQTTLPCDPLSQTSINWNQNQLKINSDSISATNIFIQMAEEITIESLQSNFEHILTLVGQNSFIQWESFTKSSTNLNKSMEELAKALSIFRQIQQRRFISSMKKLKGCDIPDLVKTVKSKKLPKEALRSITGRFKLNGEQKLELVENSQTLRQEAKKVLSDYLNVNESLSNKIKQTATLLQQKIKDSGFYEQPQQPKELVSTFKHSFAEDKLKAAKALVQVEYLPGTVDTLHIKTYAQIIDATQQLIKSEYKRLTQEARKKQRGLNSDSKQYIDSLLEYLTNTEVLIIEGQKSLAAKLGITAQKLQQTQNTLMEKGLAQNLLFIQSTLRTKVKQSMPASKEATLEQAKEILNYQVSKLKTETEHFKKMFSQLQKTAENYQLIPMLLALALNDMVFTKYELQEEDFMKNITDIVIMQNVDIMNIFKEMELAIIKLMQQLGIISPEAGSYMQAQSQNAGSVPQSVMPGMQPGTNPLELLQLQQLQQFEQMQRAQQK